MDTNAPGKNVPQEVTRELLIAISESVPEKILDSKSSPDAPGKNVPREVTRELLIAISESVPDKILDSKSSPDNSNSVKKAKDDDNAERFRSELISISYMQSPDVKSSP